MWFKGTRLMHWLDLIGSRPCVRACIPYADVTIKNIHNPPLVLKSSLKSNNTYFWMNETVKNNYNLLSKDILLLQYSTCFDIIGVCMKYIKGVIGAKNCCTKSGDGLLGLKNVAYWRQNILLQYIVLFYGVVNSYSFATHKAISYRHEN